MDFDKNEEVRRAAKRFMTMSEEERMSLYAAMPDVAEKLVTEPE